MLRAALRSSGARARPSRRSPTSELDQHDRQRHQHDQHRAVGERDAVVAVADAADDVGRGQFVLGGDQEDHRRHRRHRAHEAVDQRGDQRRLEQRQHDAAQRRAVRGRAASTRPRRGWVDLLERRGAGAHADRQVAEHEAQHDDQAGAGELERRHVEGQDVAHAEHRAGNRERQQRGELERAAAANRLRASSHAISRPSAADSGAAMAGELERREQRVPRRAGPDQAVAAPLDVERGDEVLERRRVVAAPGLHEAADEGEHVDAAA